MPFSPERESTTRDSESSSRYNFVDDVSQRFKTYLDYKVEALSSGLVSQTVTETQKLNRAAEAKKLKLAGNKDQFLFNSELSTAVGEAKNFLAANDIPKAHEKRAAQLSKSLQHRQKIITLADKSEAGRFALS